MAAAPKIPWTDENPLGAFLRYTRSGYADNLTQEMYDYFGGDKILEGIKKYDPSAKWEWQKGGDDNSQGGGYKLNYNHTLMPKINGQHFSEMSDTNMGKMKDPASFSYDKNYGNVTSANNFQKPKDKMWTKYAPLVVGAGGPMMGAYLASMGIGGAAGLTGAVTGSGMGGAGASKFASGVGKTLARGMPGFGRQLSNGTFNPLGLAGAALSAAGGLGDTAGELARTAGTVAKYAKTGLGIYNLTRKR